MPIFDFRCAECGQVFDELVRSADSIGEIACPKCGARKVERLVSAFAAASSRSGTAGTRPESAVKRGGCGPSCGCGA